MFMYFVVHLPWKLQTWSAIQDSKSFCPGSRCLGGATNQTACLTATHHQITKPLQVRMIKPTPRLHDLTNASSSYNQCEEPNAWRVVVNLLQNNPHQDAYCPTIGRLVASSSSVQFFCFWSLLMPVFAEHVISSWSSAPTRLLEGFW